VSLLVQSDVVGGNSLDATVFIVDDLAGRTTRVDLNAERLRLLTQPLDHIAQAHNIISFIVQLRDHREGKRCRFSEESKAVSLDCSVERGLQESKRQTGLNK